MNFTGGLFAAIALTYLDAGRHTCHNRTVNTAQEKVMRNTPHTLWVDVGTLMVALHMRTGAGTVEELSKQIPEISTRTLQRVHNGEVPSIDVLLVLLWYADIEPGNIIRRLPSELTKEQLEDIPF